MQSTLDRKTGGTGVLDRMLTAQEAADRLNIKIGWLYDHSMRGTMPFPCVKIGKLLRFPESGIDKYIADGGTEKRTKK